MTLRELLPPELTGLDYLIGRHPASYTIHFWAKVPGRGPKSLLRPTEPSRYPLCQSPNNFYPERIIFDKEGEFCADCLRRAGL